MTIRKRQPAPLGTPKPNLALSLLEGLRIESNENNKPETTQHPLVTLSSLGVALVY